VGLIREKGVMGHLGNPNIFFHYRGSPINEYTGSRGKRAGAQDRNTRVGRNKQIKVSIAYHWQEFK
jgi:hypothetical protein